MSNTATIYDSNWFTDADKLTTREGLEATPRAASTAAKELVAKFKTGSGTVFTKLDRAQVANDLDFRLRFQNAFRQQDSPFCGIAAFLRFWAHDQPLAYTRFAIGLFEKGWGRLESAGKHTGQVIKPSAELRNSAPRYNMGQADWMVMASIREALNNDFNYWHYKSVLQMTGGTLRRRVEMEFRKAGYSRIVTSGADSAIYRNLTEASALYEKNWRVILEIRPWLLKATEREGELYKKTSRETHYIGLDSEIVISNFNGKPLVQPFTVWTWGSTSTFPGWKQALPLDAFAGCLWYCAGKY